MSVKLRQELERKIVKAAITSLLDAGFTIEVDNGGDEPELAASTSKSAILKACFLTDDERLYVSKNGKAFGWVLLVYGNDGWDVISDYTVNLEQYIGEGSEAYKISEKYS